MRLVTTFCLSRLEPTRFGVNASLMAWNKERSLMRCAPQSEEISDAETPQTFSLYALKKCRYSRQPKRAAMNPSSVSGFFGFRTRTQRYDATQRVASTGPRLRNTFIGT